MSTSQSASNNRSNRRSSSNRSNRGGRRPKSGQLPKKPKSLISRILGIFGIGAAKKASATKVTRETVRSSDSGTSARTSDSPARERKPRPVEKLEVTSPRLYVGNLSYDAREDDLQQVFNGVGTVVDVEISTNSRTQRSKGFAFVEMASIEEARRAVEELHDKELMGRKMLVSGAKPKS